MPITLNGTTGIQDVLGTAAAPALSNTTSTNVGLYFPTSTTLGLATNGAAALTIDASQNVGIGTTSPAGKFAVKTSDTAVIGYFGGTTYATRAGANSSFATLEGVDAATGVSSYQPLQVGGSILSLATGGSERMRVDASGNINIASSGIGAKLYVFGNAASSISALTYSATTTIDLSTANNFSITLTGNVTFANPTNPIAGQTGSIFITQDGTGSRTASWGANWDWISGTAPTLTTTANAVDRIDFIVRTTSSIQAVFTANYS